ncbi:hypothetical protein ACC736_39470, partial [Rhizobium ruizarguesonis]
RCERQVEGRRATARIVALQVDHDVDIVLAPVHVGWLGFPGSTVNVDLDYVIGDHFVLTEVAKHFYHEKLCRLPESYQTN